MFPIGRRPCSLPDWSREDPATIVPQRRGAFVGLALPPATVSTPERRVSWGPLPFEKASESDSGTACCSASQLSEGSRAQHSAGRLFPAPTGSFTSVSNERVVARRATQQTRVETEDWDGTSAGPLAFFGKPRSDAPCWSPVEQWSQLPTRQEERRCSRGNKLRAGSSCSPLA